MKNIYLKNINKKGLTGILFLFMILTSQFSWGQSYSDGYPSYSEANESTVSIDIKFTSSGWYSDVVILPATEAAPSIQNVIDWSYDGNAGTLVSGTWGEVTTSVNRSGAQLVSFSASNLDSGTDYIAYIVTSSGWTTETAIEQDAPTQVSFSTVSLTTPPSITAYSPTPGEENVSLNDDFVLTFNENIQFVSGSEALLRIRKTGGTTIQLFDVDASNLTISNNTLSISHNALSEGQKYYITMGDGFLESTSSLQDFSGISDTTQWYFTTYSTAPVTTFSPDSAESSVSVSSYITVSYDKEIRNASDTTVLTDDDLASLITLIDKDSNSLDFSATIDNNTITIIPTSSFSDNDTITVTVAAIANKYGVTQTEDQTCIFYTANYNIWTGNIDNDFSNSANYEDGYYTSGARTFVQAGGQNLVFSSDAEMPELIIEPLASVTINNGVTVTIENELLLESDATGSASLINNGTINTNSSNIIVEQYTLGSSSYSPIGSMVSSSTFSDAGGDGSIYYWNDTNGSWASGASGTMTPGKGYIAKSTNKLEYSGSLNTADSYTLTAEGSSKNSGYSLVSNPYTASLDWDLLSDSSNIHNEFWIYLNGGQTYCTYNGASGIGSNTSGDASLIPAGHAFWIRANWVSVDDDPISGYVTFTKDALTQNDKTYIKAETTSSSSSIHLVGIHGDITDENIILFKDEASASYDQYDSEKMFTSFSNEVLELYTNASNKNLVINALPYNSISDTTIALGYKVKTSGTFEIKLSELDNFDDGTQVILTDSVENTQTDLTSTSYSFTSDAANTLERFYLTIKTSTITTPVENNLATNKNIKVFSTEKIVHMKLGDIQDAEYNVFDMAGNLIQTGELAPYSDNQTTISKSGFYIVHIVSSDNNVSKKVVIE